MPALASCCVYVVVRSHAVCARFVASSDAAGPDFQYVSQARLSSRRGPIRGTPMVVNVIPDPRQWWTHGPGGLRGDKLGTRTREHPTSVTRCHANPHAAVGCGCQRWNRADAARPSRVRRYTDDRCLNGFLTLPMRDSPGFSPDSLILLLCVVWAPT